MGWNSQKGTETFSVSPNNLFFPNRANVIDNWTWSDIYAAYNRTYAPGSETAVFYHKQVYDYIIRAKLNRTDPPNLLKERFMLEARALKFPPYHFLFEVFEEMLQHYIEGDFINFSNKYRDEASNPKKFEAYEEPFAVLTLDELEAGFVVCLVPLLSSIFIFAIEWIPNIQHLIVFRILSQKYFDA